MLRSFIVQTETPFDDTCRIGKMEYVNTHEEVKMVCLPPSFSSGYLVLLPLIKGR